MVTGTRGMAVEVIRDSRILDVLFNNWNGGWWGASRMMPRFLVSASGRMGFHYLRKAEGEASLDRSGIQFLMCYL